MRYILLVTLVLSLLGCKKDSSLVQYFQTSIDILTIDGTPSRTFAAGEDFIFSYTRANLSTDLIEYYSDNCPLLSFTVLDADGNFVGEVYSDLMACTAEIRLRMLKSKERVIRQVNWQNEFNALELSAGTYTLTFHDRIELFKTGEIKDVNLSTMFTIK